MLSEAFSVVEFQYRVFEDGYAVAVAPYWGIVATFGDGESRVIYETDRRGLATLKLQELVKLICDPASEWRARLPKGLDAELLLWTSAVPLSRAARIEERKRVRRRKLPDWLAA